MPSDWQALTLAEAGVSLIDCDHRTPPAVSVGYPYIAIPQLKDGHVALDGVRRISREHLDEWTKKLKPQEHDVIVVRRCNSGISAVVPRGVEWAIGQNLVVLRTNGTRVRPEFLRWLVRGEEWWEQVRKYMNVGAVFDSLKCRDIPNFTLLIPPPREQARIAEALSAVDNRINLLRKTNSTLESIAQALFKSWFIDFDPVRAKAEGREPGGMDATTAEHFPEFFEASALGMIPTGWAVRDLADLVHRVGMGPFGSNIKVSTFVDSGIPILSGACLRSTLLEDGNYRFISHDHARKLAGALVGKGDIVITHRGTLGQVSIVPAGSSYPTYVLSQSQFYVRANSSAATPEFLTYFLRSPSGQHLLLANASQVGVPSISRPVSYIKSLKLAVPPLDVTNAFSAVTTKLHDRIVAARRQIGFLAELRDALLPRLISGKLRIPEARAELEEAIS